MKTKLIVGIGMSLVLGACGSSSHSTGTGGAGGVLGGGGAGIGGGGIGGAGGGTAGTVGAGGATTGAGGAATGAGGASSSTSLPVITGFTVLGQQGPGGRPFCDLAGACFFNPSTLYKLPPNGTTATMVPATGIPTGQIGFFALDGLGSVFTCAPNPASMGASVFELASGATTWTSVGTGLPASLTCREGIARDSGGALYVPNGNDGLWALSPGQTTWAVAGTGLPMLTNATWITTMATLNGDLYVGRYDGLTGKGNGVYVLKSGTSSFTALPLPDTGLVPSGAKPTELSVDSKGNLYVRFDALGNPVAGTTNILILSAGGSAWTRTTGTPGGGTNLVIDGHDDGYFVDNAAGLYKLAAGTLAWTKIADITGLHPQETCATGGLADDHIGHLVLMCTSTLLRSQP